MGEKISSRQTINLSIASQDFITPGIVTARDVTKDTNHVPTNPPPTHSRTPLTLASFPSASPVPTPTLIELGERCNPGCGSPHEPPTTAIVTTILSTSVPCTLPTLTSSATSTISTIYATETITSTITIKGTVYIIEYEYLPTPTPTPVVYPTPVESVFGVDDELDEFLGGGYVSRRSDDDDDDDDDDDEGWGRWRWMDTREYRYR